MRRRSKKRTHSGPEGFLAVNKPAGMTARAVLNAWLKQIPGKAGMEGVLDPFANGLLIFGYGNATRYLPYFLNLEKEYVASLILGTETDTLDKEGEIIKSELVPALTEEIIKKTLNTFKGEYTTLPPVYSNIRIEGERAHTTARSGGEVNMQTRTTFIHEIEFLHYDPDTTTLQFRTLVASGTYIRSLGRDIAKQLGTVGHLSELSRPRIGPFTIEEALPWPPTEQTAEHLVSAEEMLLFMPVVQVNDEQKNVLLYGGWINLESEKGYCRLFCGEEFLGIGERLGEKVKPERLLRGA